MVNFYKFLITELWRLFDLSLETLLSISRQSQPRLFDHLNCDQQQVRSCYQTYSVEIFHKPSKSIRWGVKCARPGLACCSHLQLSSLQSLNPSFHQSQKWISARIMITISYNWTSYSALSRYSVQQLRRQVMIITLSLHCGSITVWYERIYFAGLAAAGPDRLTPIRVWAR